MTDKTAKLHIEGHDPLEFPIISGNEGTAGIDISSLRAESNRVRSERFGARNAWETPVKRFTYSETRKSPRTLPTAAE